MLLLFLGGTNWLLVVGLKYYLLHVRRLLLYRVPKMFSAGYFVIDLKRVSSEGGRGRGVPFEQVRG